ncbi:MAG: glycosyltransferase [Aquabacterium sp.]
MRLLFAATPMPGHVAPLLGAARGLVERGHEVIFQTGSVFREAVERIGARFVPLHEEVDIDWRHIDERFPERAQLPSGPAQMMWGVRHLFADAIGRQHEGLQAILASQREAGAAVDAIVIDTLFCGAFPMLLAPPTGQPRVPVVSLGVSVLALTSADTAFFGLALPPARTARGRARNLALHEGMQQGAFGPLQQYIDDALAQVGSPPLPCFISDAGCRLPDRCLQLTTERFDYPHHDLPPTVTFAGPIIPPPPAEFTPPAWWHELDGSRPVVVVTQGTVANADPHQLVVPTLQALANEDVLVIAGTGGPAIDTIPGPIPANARLGTFLPFHHLLPKASVLVSNGGLGGVTHALSLGVPLVIAGDSEEKPEIAARVAWNEAGIDLATGRPDALLLRTAVREVLRRPQYKAGALAMQADFARYDAVATIERHLQELCA